MATVKMMNALALPEATETGTTTTTGKETSATEDGPTSTLPLPLPLEDAPEDGRRGSMFQLIKDSLFEYDPPVANLAKRRASVVNAKGDADLNAVLSFKFQPELIRFIAYIGFWTMCILAIIITNTFVAPALLAGPEPGVPSCPPFETGVGFEIATDSHLVRAFGFNNVSSCSNSRAVQEMIFLAFASSNIIVFEILRYVQIGIILHLVRLRQHIILSSSIHFCSTFVPISCQLHFIGRRDWYPQDTIMYSYSVSHS